MSKCDSYHLEPEQHYFVDEYGAPIYEIINVPRCWGRALREIEQFNFQRVADSGNSRWRARRIPCLCQ